MDRGGSSVAYVTGGEVEGLVICRGGRGIVERLRVRGWGFGTRGMAETFRDRKGGLEFEVVGGVVGI